MSLILTEVADSVLTITFNEPARRNPLSADMRAEVVEAIENRGPEVRAVVFVGADGVFSAGGDLSSMPPENPAAAVERMKLVADFTRLISTLPIITVAAVEGAVAGASVGLVAGCDVVVAGRGAKFVLPFARLNLVPDGGLLALLPARVGAARAKRLLLAADPFDAVAGAEWGLVDELVDDGAALAAAQATAARMGQRAPGSVRWIKNTMAQGVPDLDTALAAESDGQSELFFMNDFAEGKAAFFEKRAATFTDS